MKRLFFGEHRLLARVLGLCLGRRDGPLRLVEVVVSGIGRELAAVDLDDLRDDPVHEFAIMRSYDQRALEAAEELLEPDDRLDVEVVRRLVEEERVGPDEEDARERDAHLPAARELADVVVDHVFSEAESGQDLARAGLERVAAELVEARLRLARIARGSRRARPPAPDRPSRARARGARARLPQTLPAPAIVSSSTVRPAISPTSWLK